MDFASNTILSLVNFITTIFFPYRSPFIIVSINPANVHVQHRQNSCSIWNTIFRQMGITPMLSFHVSSGIINRSRLKFNVIKLFLFHAFRAWEYKIMLRSKHSKHSEHLQAWSIQCKINLRTVWSFRIIRSIRSINQTHHFTKYKFVKSEIVFSQDKGFISDKGFRWHG